ncbi:peptidase [Pasteurellaceae bacterium LFhippo2]|nr:peptidase [Pasteurellaceae bacterium LFhippo2]
MMLLIFALILAFWFKRELVLFPIKVNQQNFNEYKSLFSNEVSFNDFLDNSKIQSKESCLPCLFFVIYPVIIWLLQDYSLPIIAIVLILIYLSVLDFFYYLTDSRYIAIIFLLSLTHLLFFQPENITENLFTLFITTLFFCLFTPIANFAFKKETLGLGDVLLFCALSPLFNLNQMVLLLLFSSLSGLLFALGCFLITKQKVSRLPFIPFITGAVLMVIHIDISM